jgi:hypothetical protein
MAAMTSTHASLRAQQRAIPPVVDRWLDEFGEQQHDGHGGIRVYFSRRSVRAMERALGSHFIRQNGKYLNAYRVESAMDGCVITAGWRTCKIREG